MIEVTKDNELIKVSATFGKKVQVNQFEPVDASCSVSETCKKNEVEATYARLYEFCKKQVLVRIDKEIEEAGVLSGKQMPKVKEVPPQPKPEKLSPELDVEDYKQANRQKKAETREDASKRLLELADYWKNKKGGEEKYKAIVELIEEIPTEDSLPF